MSFDYSDIDLAENPDPRAMVQLVLDCSDSMTDVRPGETRTPLDSLNGALDVLVSEIHKDPLSRRRIELSVIPYGTQIGDPTPFATISNISLPNLEPMGITNTGAALKRALDNIEERKQKYKENGISYYQPMVYLISDGLSMDDMSEVSDRIKEMEKNKKLSFFAIGVEGADIDQLSTIGSRPALQLSGVKFNELFEWVSASAASVSASNPGDRVALPSGLDAWAEL